jgi:hypothetical protein
MRIAWLVVSSNHVSIHSEHRVASLPAAPVNTTKAYEELSVGVFPQTEQT